MPEIGIPVLKEVSQARPGIVLLTSAARPRSSSAGQQLQRRPFSGDHLECPEAAMVHDLGNRFHLRYIFQA